MKKGIRKPIPVKIVHDDTVAATNPYREKDRMNINIRQIENGYIVNKHGVKGGKHFDKEFFTTKAPNLNTPKSSGRQLSRNARLRGAKI